MNILITGANGFVGKNLCLHLKNKYPEYNIIKFDIGDDLENVCKEADYVFHLAGVAGKAYAEEFNKGNTLLTKELLIELTKHKKPPVAMASSLHALNQNPYGVSKKAAEELLIEYGKNTKTFIFRFPNLFGKWSKPNYNSVVSTFCYNITHGLPIEIRDKTHEITLMYIDDACEMMLDTLTINESNIYSESIKGEKITVGDLAELIYSFKTQIIPDLSNDFVRKLYSTYISYITDLTEEINPKADNRGAFVELLKSKSFGQVSINVTNPGSTKGNHYHHTKWEKFITISGEGVIRLRKIGETEIKNIFVNAVNPKVVNIPPGYTHSMVNTSQADLVTLIWADEVFDENKPDTFYEEV